jgi:hypothetical protein
MAVVCSSLILCFLSTSLRYCLNDFEMLRVAHIITGITYSFIFHTRFIYILVYLYFIIFSAYLLITYLSTENATSLVCMFFFIIMDCDAQLIVRDGSVGLL